MQRHILQRNELNTWPLLPLFVIIKREKQRLPMKVDAAQVVSGKHYVSGSYLLFLSQRYFHSCDALMTFSCCSQVSGGDHLMRDNLRLSRIRRELYFNLRRGLLLHTVPVISYNKTRYKKLHTPPQRTVLNNY